MALTQLRSDPWTVGVVLSESAWTKELLRLGEAEMAPSEKERAKTEGAAIAESGADSSAPSEIGGESTATAVRPLTPDSSAPVRQRKRGKQRPIRTHIEDAVKHSDKPRGYTPAHFRALAKELTGKTRRGS